MGESTARIGIYADDRASPVVKSVQGSLTGLQQTAKQSILTGVGLGSGVAAFAAVKQAIGAVTDFLGESIQAAIDDEESVSRLGQSLKANIPNWTGNTAAIEKQIAASELLGFKDEDLRASMALLVGATHDVRKAQELQAAAMDLARLKGIDLATASDALVKVEGGRYRILASLGIQLGKNATQTEVLAAIQKVAAGQAKEFANTTAGAMLGAQIQFDELKEDIGREFLPILHDLAKFARDALIPALRDLMKTVKDMKPVWDVTGKAIELVGRGLGVILAPIALAGSAIDSLSDHAKAGFEETGKAAHGGMTEAVRAVHQGSLDIIAGAEALPGDMADAMLKGQQELADAGKQLVDFMAAALSPAQVIARDIGFLSSTELSEGLKSGNPLVRTKAQELRDAALAELEDLTGVRSSGSAIGNAWIGGITGAIQNGVYAMTIAVNGIRNTLGHSLPTAGPLKGRAAEMGGLAIGKSWAEGISKGIGSSMPSLSLPSVSGGSGALAPVAAASGSPVVIQLQVDGRTLAEIVDRQLYYAQSGASRFPRG